jgi:transcription initiation factor IIF auxiliary subunit
MNRNPISVYGEGAGSINRNPFPFVERGWGDFNKSPSSFTMRGWGINKTPLHLWRGAGD